MGNIAIRPAWALWLGLVVGCASAPRPATSLPEVATEQAKCKVAASQESPLVTEWAASQKANLEAGLGGGGVLVSYSGCEMRILPGCQADGRYVWQRTTLASDRIDIRDQDELWAKLPLGAANLEGELGTAGRLVITTTVSGQMRLTGVNASRPQLQGECREATHIVSALSVGAFELTSGSRSHAQGKAGVVGAGDVGAGTQNQQALVKSAGQATACVDASDQAPNVACRSPLQVFLTPLPSTLSKQTPRGMHDIRFVADNPQITWQVKADEQLLCETPCVTRVSEHLQLILEEKSPGFLQRPAITAVPNLRQQGSGPFEVRVFKSKGGRLAGGIVTTALSGVLMMTGITLSAVGCRADEGGKAACITGIALLPVSAIGIAGGVYWIVDSGPYTDVTTQPGLLPPTNDPL